MSKTTKLWISNELELRHAINGWPVAHTDGYAATDMYADELAHAKNNSIDFDNEEKHLIRIYIPLSDLKPNTFVDIGAEVSVIDQYFDEVQKEWCDYYEHTNKAKIFNRETRQVARLKPKAEMTVKEEEKLLSSFTESPIPNKQRCEHELAIEKFFGLVNWPVEEPIEEGQDYTNLVNLVCMASEDLKSQLDAANKRVKELEDALDESFGGRWMPSLKANILEAFGKRWLDDDSIDPHQALSEVLDELGIK